MLLGDRDRTSQGYINRINSAIQVDWVIKKLPYAGQEPVAAL